MKKATLIIGSLLIVGGLFGCGKPEEQASTTPVNVTGGSAPKAAGGGAPASAPAPTPGPGPTTK